MDRVGGPVMDRVDGLSPWEEAPEEYLEGAVTMTERERELLEKAWSLSLGFEGAGIRVRAAWCEKDLRKAQEVLGVLAHEADTLEREIAIYLADQ